MANSRYRILMSKGWTVAVCALSVLVLALTGSCRSKKVAKEKEPVSSAESMSLDDMMFRVDSLKQVLDRRSRSLIYGPPEVMQRRAAENEAMRHEIDSLDAEIKKMINL